MSRLATILILIWSSFALANESINPYFYRIQFNGKTSYLLGTFHEGIAADELPSFVLTELKNSKRVIFEANIEALKMLGRNNMDTQLSRTLSLTAWNYVCDRLEPFFSKLDINRMAPWYVTRLLSVLDGGSTLSNLKMMDKELLEMAVENKIEVEFFATNREHIALYLLRGPVKDLEERAQVLAINDTIAENEFAIRRYRNGNAILEEELLNEMPVVAREIFFDQRNQAWMPKLMASVTQGQSFVAVGASHLFGKMGLLKLLKSQGAKVDRILGCDQILVQDK